MSESKTISYINRINELESTNKKLETENASLRTTLEEVQKKLAATEQTSNNWYKSFASEKEITDGLHDVLDGMGVRRFRDKNEYQTIPLSVRLFSWAMSIATGTKPVSPLPKE